MGNKKEKNEAEQNIITALKEYRGGNVKLPNTITFSMSESANPSLIIKLQRRAVGLTEGKEKPFNMQEDGAAFEGWAVIIRALYKEETWKEQKEKYEFLAKWNGKIILDAENAEKPLPPYQVTEGHYGRFLYRAMRFQETYGKWFQLSKEVQKAADDFKKVLNESTFTNNLPKGKAQTNTSLENTVEAEFEKQEDLFQKIMKKKIPKISKGISRQLPCGLFQGEIKQANRIFTGGKSAIDFWNYTKIDGKNNMTIAELKAKSKMIGIITEIFFYANYCRDLFGTEQNSSFEKNPDEKKQAARGYHFLADNKMDKINAVMLADAYHPLIDEAVLNVMNENENVPITYYRELYQWGELIKPLEGN